MGKFIDMKRYSIINVFNETVELTATGKSYVVKQKSFEYDN